MNNSVGGQSAIDSKPSPKDSHLKKLESITNQIADLGVTLQFALNVLCGIGAAPETSTKEESAPSGLWHIANMHTATILEQIQRCQKTARLINEQL